MVCKISTITKPDSFVKVETAFKTVECGKLKIASLNSCNVDVKATDAVLLNQVSLPHTKPARVCSVSDME